MENVTYNKYSKILQKILDEARPKVGQTIWFTSERPYSRGSTVLPYDSVFDPGTKEHINIAYFVGRNPAKGKQPAEDVLGRIQFTKSAQGRMAITGGNKQQELLFNFLYLTNQNKNNQPSKTKETGSEWFVAGKPVVFHMEEPSKTAEQKLEDNRKIRQAQQAVDEMAEEKLRDLAIGLEMTGINSHSKPDEIRVKLINMAATPTGAAKVLALDTDRSLQIKIELKDAEKKKIVEHDSALSVWKWSDGGETICVVPPGSKKYEAITQYFLNKGGEAYKLMKQLADAQK